MATLSEKAGQLLEDKNIAAVATIREDGTPQVTPVWIDWDGENVLFNTAEGRAKPKNLRRDPRVSVLVVDRENPYAWVSVTGRAELTHEGADEHIDKLAQKYLGQERYPFHRPDEQRVMLRIKPDHVLEQGTS